jgi:hypothetical protein
MFEGSAFEVVASDGPHDAFAFVDACIREWDRFLAERGLSVPGDA